MSIATTRPASFAICSVNQPSPQHRSITFMPGRTPTAASTFAGSGHSASHQPAVGISVPSKKPGSLAIATDHRHICPRHCLRTPEPNARGR